MNAKYKGTCGICHKPWDKGARIGRWLGKMVHLGCKEHELSRVHSEAHVEVLPEHRGSADKVKTVTSTRIRRDRKARITLR